MKRILALMLMATMILTLFAGCNKDNTGNTGSNANSSATADSSKEDSTEGGGDGTPKMGGTFISGLAGDPQSYNPNITGDDYGLQIYNNIFNCLVSMDMDMNIIPDLATEWEFSDDYKEITFHLTEGVKWHDGEDFTSADVKYTFDTIISESGEASSSLKAVESISCPDDLTVVFTLSQPDASLLGVIAWYATFIMPEHIYAGTDWSTNPANQNPIGTGPFKFVEHQNGVSVTLEKNEDYWREGPYLDKLVFQIIPDKETEYQAWQNGDIDFMFSMIPGIEVPQYMDNPDYNAKYNLYANRTYFVFNMEEGIFTDVRLRQAFNMAINREEVSTKGLKGNGEGAKYYLSPLFDWAVNKDVKIPEQNIEGAKKLLEEAGYTPDANGIYLTATIDVFSGFEDSLVVCQANLKEAGIDLKINLLEFSAWVEKVKDGHDFEVSMLAGYQGPDVGAIRYRVYYSEDGTGNNMGSYKNDRVQELIDLGAQVFDQEERKPYYMELQEILAEDLPMVLINENGTTKVVKSNIHGVPVIDDSVRNTMRSGDYSKVWFE